MSEVIYRTTHMCMDIEGFMRNAKFPKDYRGMFKHDDGRSMTPDEARSELFACLRKGWHVIPMGDCDNFDYQTGCKGHPADSRLTTHTGERGT